MTVCNERFYHFSTLPKCILGDARQFKGSMWCLKDELVRRKETLNGRPCRTKCAVISPISAALGGIAARLFIPGADSCAFPGGAALLSLLQGHQPGHGSAPGIIH